MFKKALQFLILFLSSVLFPVMALAKTVNLYDQPAATSKVVGTIDSSSELVPIFTNKEGDWMKVGDPKNGTVGWIKVSDMGNKNGMGMSFTQKTVETSSGPRTVQTIKFEEPKVISSDEATKWMKNFQKQQAEIQRYSQQMLQHVYDQMNTFYKENPQLFDPKNFPVIMPIIIMPPQNNGQAPKPAPTQPAEKAPAKQ